MAAASWENRGVFHLMRRVLQRHNALWRERLPDLTPVQYSVLLSLSRLPGQDQATIGAASAVEPTTMANLIGRMEQAGLVVRHTDPSDRRRYCLDLTVRGRIALDAATPTVHAVRDECLAALPTTQVAQLRVLLSDLSGSATAGIQAARAEGDRK